MTEEWLQQNALWIIIDPWKAHPFMCDRKLFKECTTKHLLYGKSIDQHNFYTVQKIAEYFTNVRHKSISLYSKFKPHPLFKSYINFKDQKPLLVEYMTSQNLNHIVYCGFHYGICIRKSPVGLKRTHKQYTTWVKKSLCSQLPFKLSEKEADLRMKQYGIII